MEIGWALIVLGIFSKVVCEVKFWSASSSDEDYWDSIKIACPNSRLIFEKDMPTELILPEKAMENGVILPNNGILVFRLDSEFYFAEKIYGNFGLPCADNFTEFIMSVPKSHYWFLGKNWQSETNRNPAKPDMEKVPCHNDDVVVNSEAPRIDLQEYPFLYINSMTIDMVSARASQLHLFLKTPGGQMVFQNSDETIVESPNFPGPNPYCHLEHQEGITEQVCANTKCTDKPHCLNPIQPYGFCCKICGASLLVRIDQTKKFDLQKFNQRIESFIAESEQSDVAFYASFIRVDGEIVIQLSLVEKEIYTGKTNQLMDRIKVDIIDKLYNRPMKSIYSGIPYNPNGSGNTALLILLPMFAIIGMLFLFYKSTYGETNISFNPRIFLSRWLGGGQFIFARFENTGQDDDEDRIRIGSPKVDVRVEEVETEDEEEEEEDNATGLELRFSSPPIQKATPFVIEKETTVLEKDHIDEVVDSITSDESHLIDGDE